MWRAPVGGGARGRCGLGAARAWRARCGSGAAQGDLFTGGGRASRKTVTECRNARAAAAACACGRAAFAAGAVPDSTPDRVKPSVVTSWVSASLVRRAQTFPAGVANVDGPFLRPKRVERWRAGRCDDDGDRDRGRRYAGTPIRPIAHFTVGERVARGLPGPRFRRRRARRGGSRLLFVPTRSSCWRSRAKTRKASARADPAALVSPFTFFRGVAYDMAADLGMLRATRSSAATRTCRTSGCFRLPTPTRVRHQRLRRDAAGPFECDLKRLADELRVAGRRSG